MVSNNYHTEYAVELPKESSIVSLYEKAYLSDAYAILLPPDVTHNPELIARFMFDNQASWVNQLMRLRDAIVGWFGLKTATKLITSHQDKSKERVHIFKIYQKLNNEIILGEDDKHLDFRVSVLLRAPQTSEQEERELMVTTIVHCHNALGRTYIKVIKPFHCKVVRSAMRKAAQSGWPLV